MHTEIFDLSCFSLHNWYEKFKEYSIKSLLIPIPSNVLDYILYEQFILPKECGELSKETDSNNFIGEECKFDSDDDNDEDYNAPEFPEFSKVISETLEKLGKKAFIKTNWSCPKDSCWITTSNILCVSDLTDVYQLLKASSICQQDFLKPGPHYLVMKEWKEIDAGAEFRCFVRNKKLIAISPRDFPEFHQHFESHRLEIIEDITDFFKKKIERKFNTLNYCFDIIYNSRNNLTIIDFSPFNAAYTDALAFKWDELISEDFSSPEFRYVECDIGIQPTSKNNYGIPQDVIDMFKEPQENDKENFSVDEGLVNQIHRLLLDKKVQNQN